MNKEEILAMEAGSALDELIAKKLFNALTITKASKLSDKTFYALVGGEEEQYQPLEKGRTLANVWWRHTEKEAWDACPNYSTDISAAWEVVEKLRPTHIYELADFGRNRHKHCQHYAAFHPINEPRDFERQVNSKTSTEAICKAALLAVIDS